MPIYSLCERKTAGGAEPRGISCDEEGVFIAGDVPLVARPSGAQGQIAYQARPDSEIDRLLRSAYGAGLDFSAHVEGLNRIARYMTDGKWALAMIATVQLRLPDVLDDLARARLFTVEADLIAKCCSRCAANKTRKRDVSNEPRIPAGQSGGGEWTDNGSSTSTTNPRIVPVQAEVLPVPGTLPAPLEIPGAPTEIAPFPFALPGAGFKPRPPLVNPYPNKRKCVEEWENAFEFCKQQKEAGKLKPGYGGFGKDFTSCVLGQVSEECGGNPTA